MLSETLAFSVDVVTLQLECQRPAKDVTRAGGNPARSLDTGRKHVVRSILWTTGQRALLPDLFDSCVWTVSFATLSLLLA